MKQFGILLFLSLYLLMTGLTLCSGQRKKSNAKKRNRHTQYHAERREQARSGGAARGFYEGSFRDGQARKRKKREDVACRRAQRELGGGH